MIKIIAIGKKHDSDLANAISSYEKRLKQPFNVNWVILPNSSKTGDNARQDESEAILKRIDTDDYVILLDERGVITTSEKFSNDLQHPNTVIVIGGAFGVNENLRRRADIVVALSGMVFPHQLVRLILIEQIYRSQAIATSHPYHHI